MKKKSEKKTFDFGSTPSTCPPEHSTGPTFQKKKFTSEKNEDFYIGNFERKSQAKFIEFLFSLFL